MIPTRFKKCKIIFHVVHSFKVTVSCCVFHIFIKMLLVKINVILIGAGLISFSNASKEEVKYSNSMILFNQFDHYYDRIIRKKERTVLFEPSAIDYSLFMQKYENEQHEHLKFNPVDSNELRYHQLYFDYSAVSHKSPERIFVDFFVKYKAAIATLHFIISAFIAQQGKDYGKYEECSYLAYYTSWFFNLEIERHIFELKNILSKINGSEEYYKILDAFQNVKMGLDDLFSLHILPQRIEALYEYGKKRNPFDSTKKKEIFPLKGRWLLIITQLKYLEIPENSKITPHDFKLTYCKEDRLPLNSEENPRSTSFFYNFSWKAVDIFLGDDLHRLEAFFFSALEGKKYKSKRFVKPNINFYGIFWNEIETLYDKIWKSNVTELKQNYNGHGEKIYRSNVIGVLRRIEYLQFQKIEFSSVYENKFNKKFKLLSCKKVFVALRPLKCSNTLKMITEKDDEKNKKTN